MIEADLQIERLSQLGEGVGTHEGHAVFVAGAFPGERVHARIEQVGRVRRGELLSLLTPSPARRAPPCPVSETCGGCDWLALDESAQRAAKEEIVLSTLEHLGGLSRDAFELLPMAFAGPTLGYRRRAVLHVFREGLGFFGRRSHTHVPIERCPALVAPLAELPGRLAPLLASARKDLAELHLLASGDAVAAALFAKAALKPKLRDLGATLIREHGFQGVILIPKDGPSEQLGDPILSAPAPLREDTRLFLRPDAFSQASAEANALLVRTALELAAPEPKGRALELYAGNGNFSLALAARVQALLAVEASPLSSGLGQRAAREGRVENLRFVQGDAAKVAQGLIREGERFELLLADPPRTGAPGIGDWAQRLAVQRVVYVACDAAALARDARGLVAAGFTPERLRLVDQFPQTHHVEAVMSFTRSGR
jgi:23S rRNA (uracil1939-C5)-methyltransferase